MVTFKLVEKSKSKRDIWYGDHAIRKIRKHLREGETPRLHRNHIGGAL